MPLLLLLPLLLAAILALWVLLLPLAMVQRYRMGRARRRALPWVVHANAWLLAVSALLLMLGAWLGGHWIDHALRDAGAGLLAGIGVGIVGVWSSRFEATPRGLYYTPNRWLVLLLTSLLAARIVLGAWLGWHSLQSAPAALQSVDWIDHAGLVVVGSVLLGYYLAYAWGLRRRLG